MKIKKGSVVDVFAVPFLVFITLFLLLIGYYVFDYLNTLNLNQTFSSEAQETYSSIMNAGFYSLQMFDIMSLGLVFACIISAGLLAFMIRSHPAFFPIFVFFGAVMIFVAVFLSEIVNNYFVSSSEFGGYFQAPYLTWVLVLKENLPILISLTTGFILIALYFKPLGVS